MSYNYAGSSVVKALTLAFFTGAIEIAAGLLQLGKNSEKTEPHLFEVKQMQMLLGMGL